MFDSGKKYDEIVGFTVKADIFSKAILRVKMNLLLEVRQQFIGWKSNHVSSSTEVIKTKSAEKKFDTFSIETLSAGLFSDSVS